jgi:hypothetical protein
MLMTVRTKSVAVVYADEKTLTKQVVL